jgi:DNA polymerase-3 subunit gamma/tau
MRDLIVSKSGGLGALLELPESLKKKYKEQADRCPLPFLYEGLSITTQCESGYRASVNPRLHIEFALMKLSFICNKEAVSAPAPAPAPVAQPAPTPAPAPAPAVQPVAAAPAAEEQPRERRQRSSRGAAAALTMKAVMDDKPAVETVVETANVPLPSDEALKAKWPELAQMYAAKQPRLASMLSSSALTITSDGEYKTVVFRVVNEAQKDWVESKLLHDLEGNYRRLTGSMKIYLRVEITPEEAVQEKVAYMPSDQAKELMAKNDEVKSLVQDLGLDIK